MKNHSLTIEAFTPDLFDIKDIPDSIRDRLVISAVRINGKLTPLSYFGDDIWKFSDTPKNNGKYKSSIHFKLFPEAYRDKIKEVTYCLLKRGRAGKKRPKKTTIHRFVMAIHTFIRYLEKLGSPDLENIPQLAFDNFVHDSKNMISAHTRKPLGMSTLVQRFIAIEALYELSQYTKTPLRQHPWPDTSAVALAQRTGANALHRQQSLTPLIPDDVFSALFTKATEYIEKANLLLNARDEIQKVDQLGLCEKTATQRKNNILLSLGYKSKTTGLRKDLALLRTSCYIVIASTSGCRNHELANLQKGAHHRTLGEDGEIYHWMRSLSEKTDAGICDWMIPAVAVRAIRVMHRWALPYQNMIANEISERRRSDPNDPEIAEAIKHADSLFLSMNTRGAKTGCRTLGNAGINAQLRKFVINANLNWDISTHQFRRKFANYVAHSKFGDLRYLKEHFKHWSIDMTVPYAMDDSWGQHFDLDLLSEIESEETQIKEAAVSTWMEGDKLSGGYGHNIKRWRREPSKLAIFKDHSSMVTSIAQSTAIRSNGHAWCTADDTACVGNTLDPSRCGGCSNAVIGKEHAPMYQALYDNLHGLLKCKDIGEPGLIRVKRDLNRYSSVLGDLGINVEIAVE